MDELQQQLQMLTEKVEAQNKEIERLKNFRLTTNERDQLMKNIFVRRAPATGNVTTGFANENDFLLVTNFGGVYYGLGAYTTYTDWL